MKYKSIHLSTTAVVALGYSHGRSETVDVEGKDGPVRVNRSDFEADQEGEKNYKIAKKGGGKSAAPTHSDVNRTGEGQDGKVQTTAAPSAPDFSRPASASTDPIDPVKNAAAPTHTTADELLVMKITTGKNKGKFTIVDGHGQKLPDDQVTLFKLGENVFDTEVAAKQMQTHTNPEPAPN